jgi:hypothetical protein
MAFSDDKPANWGCIVAAVIIVPLALFEFMVASMGGGGCEGAPQPCEGDYSVMWMVLGGLVIAGVLIAYATNALLRWIRERRKS